VADWISGLVESGGYLAIVALVFLENVFPPIPSELILPLAGSVAGRGGISLVGAIVAATIGSVAGALGWYWVGWWLGLERLKSWAAKHGRWITLSPEEIERADAWFDRHSGKSVLIGRLIPTIRTLISVPAGISGMTLRRFLLFSTLGTAAWSALLIGAGYLLGEQYESVGNWLNPVSNLVAAGLGLWYAYRVLTFDRRLRSS
jgi:membrane protein DedA with SNARE-associated domain